MCLLATLFLCSITTTSLCRACDDVFAVKRSVHDGNESANSFSFAAREGTAVCFVDDEDNRVAVEVVKVEEDFPILSRYSFSNPEFSLDCSCSCGVNSACPANCPNCLDVTTFNLGGCRDLSNGASFFQRTCCVVRVTSAAGGGDKLTAFRLGRPSTVVTLEATLNKGSSHKSTFRLTKTNPTARADLGESTSVTVHLEGTGDKSADVSGDLVVDGLGRVFEVPRGAVNDWWESDPAKLGWFRDEKDLASLRHQDLVRVTVVDCEAQRFNATILANVHHGLHESLPLDNFVLWPEMDLFVAAEDKDARSVELEVTLGGGFDVVRGDAVGGEGSFREVSVEILSGGAGTFLRGVASGMMVVGGAVHVQVRHGEVRETVLLHLPTKKVSAAKNTTFLKRLSSRYQAGLVDEVCFRPISAAAGDFCLRNVSAYRREDDGRRKWRPRRPAAAATVKSVFPSAGDYGSGLLKMMMRHLDPWFETHTSWPNNVFLAAKLSGGILVLVALCKLISCCRN